MNKTASTSGSADHHLDVATAIDEVSESAVYLLDTKCRVMSWNKGSKALLGYSANEIIGELDFKFYTPEEQAAGLPMKILNQAVRKGSVVDSGWRVRKDGTEFWAYVITTAHRDKDRKVIGFTKIINNYSEFKRLDNQRVTLHETVQTLKKTVKQQQQEIRQQDKLLKRKREQQ